MLAFALLLIPVPVAPAELVSRPAEYHGKLVWVEGEVRSVFDAPIRQFELDSAILLVEWSGTPKVARGDRVGVVGMFRGNADSPFDAVRIDVGKASTVAKLPQKP